MVEVSAMSSILCHLGNPRSSKPESLQEYGKLREQMIQAPWACLSEEEFVVAVTQKGCPFYQSLMNGNDLQELQFEKLVWRCQVFAGADFDKCDVSALEMVQRFTQKGIQPWMAYNSFSHDDRNGLHNYRLLWRVETDLNLSYDETAKALKKIRELSGNLSDKNACNNTRMWQGTTRGACFYDEFAPRLDLRSLI
jgi:hypothetical protein